MKLAGPAVVLQLTSLFQGNTCEFWVYSDWKMSRLTPVHKKDDPAEKGNYRLLSLLSVLILELGSLRYCDYGLRLRLNMLLRIIKTT